MAQNSSYVTVDGEFDSLEDRSFLTIDDYDLSGQNVILRIDINSSINPENGDLLDDTRIKRHSATVKELSDKYARVIVLAHQSRPGKSDFTDMSAHSKRLLSIIGREVKFVSDVCGKFAIQSIKDLSDGEILFLDNVRMNEDEYGKKYKSNEDTENTSIIDTFVDIVDVYVTDALSLIHI